MKLSWNEIRNRAAAFVNEWRDETREEAEAKTFWDEFFQVFGLNRRRLASFEQAVSKAGGKQGFIDLFWPGVLIAEHKSRGKRLDRAFQQALDYFPGLKEEELPRYILVSDFAQIRLTDLETGADTSFPLTELPKHLHLFGFIAGYEKRTYDDQDPVNVEAARRMGALHDLLKAAGYDGHDLEVYLVRLLFCLFADDTGIFERGAFQAYLTDRTREDGSDLGALLAQLFSVLNTPSERRQRTLDDDLAAFPYVNGRLFEEPLGFASFTAAMRARLLDACALDWGSISPAIFGSLFQSVMDAETRRNLGAHYTSEKNILKVIGPLFLDGLRAEFERIKTDRRKLADFHTRLASLHLLDPACGCGNFLVVAYRELRLLELDVLRAIYGGQQVLDIAALVRVNVDQCFGIEIEEFPAQIAQVAMWLVDHQLNVRVSEAFGQYFTRLPLRKAARILHGNALRLDWSACFGDDQPARFDFILGNPPFVGHHYQTAEQKADLALALHGIDGAGVLDFVSGWYLKAARYMEAHPETLTAFVSTNSISQGEQVGLLWNELLTRYGAKIHFAHRTFRWDNEATGRAAVHVVIVGYGLRDTPAKRLFDYDDVSGEPHERAVSNISPYLVEGPDVVVKNRSQPISDVPRMVWGNKPSDGGHFLFDTEADKDAFLQQEPGAAPWIRPFVSGGDFINGRTRYCLWLVGISPQELRRLPEVMKRVEQVKASRLASKAEATRRKAQTATLFGQIAQPNSSYLAVPEVSSERRPFIPIAFLGSDTVVSNTVQIVPGADLYHFGVLSSTMHMAWMRYTGGRLKSDYRYSNTIVYNNFPWPDAKPEQRQAVETAAQAVLDARQPDLDGGATLADLYDPRSMPPALVKAHAALDRAVDKCYRPQAFANEAARVAFLFERYEALTAGLFASAKKGKKPKKA